MKCQKPFVQGKAAYPCGQCLPCLFHRRRVWAHRIQLEGLQHAEKSFVTLTYADSSLSELRPGDLRDWLKRLRRRVAPRRIRYFAVGEYGDTTLRPHYHAALFGYGSCSGGLVVNGACQCQNCLGVRETWGFGHVFVGTLEDKSAAYIAGYVTKKMANRADPRLQALPPEFARMSLKPGIGADALWDVASVMMQWRQDECDDVPMGLRHGAIVLPLGRYLRRKLRLMVGKDESAPAAALEELEAELQAVRQVAWVSGKSVSEVYASLTEGYARTLNARLNFKPGGKGTL